MNQRHAPIGTLPASWLQHKLSWLGLIALVLGLFRDDDEASSFDMDELNG